MTFDDLIINTRYRLFDIRERTGSLITDASNDGIRWSSVILQSVCKGATLELLRILQVLKLTNNFNLSSSYQLISGLQIDLATGVLSGGFPDGVTHVFKLQTADLTRIYSSISQDKFFSYRYSLGEVAENNIPVDDAVFASFFNAEDKKIEIRTLPLYPADITNVQAFVRLPFSDLLTIGNTDELPLFDIDDLLLDFCEREARRREHNITQLKDLNLSINDKLVGLQDGLQST